MHHAEGLDIIEVNRQSAGISVNMVIQAVYEGGVLRPLEPLGLSEGAIVHLTIVKPTTTAQPASDEIARELKSATTIAQWVEATKLLPPDDGGYDIIRAMNENRLWAGEEPLIPHEGDRIK